MRSQDAHQERSCGQEMEGRTSTDDSYRYAFNGKEKDTDGLGDQTHYDYGFRIYNPEIGRFLSTDPLFRSYPNLTPYQFAGNRPIESLDLDGLEIISVHTYSFAPFDSFGGGYHGDGANRRFGDPVNPDVPGKENFRIGARVKLDLAQGKELNRNALGSESQWLNTESDFSAANFDNFKFNNNDLSFHVSGNNDEFFIPEGTPDIDVHVDVKFKDLGNRVYRVIGTVYGDRFPSNETYLTDLSGNKIFIGVSGVDNDNAFFAPMVELPFDGGERMQRFNFRILFDENDNFKEVILDNGDTYTPEQWNKLFESLNPGNTQTGTDVQSDTIQINYNNATNKEKKKE